MVAGDQSYLTIARQRATESRRRKAAIYSRLGVRRLNQGKKWIRIAPRWGFKFDPGELQSKILIFEEWIRNTLAEAPNGTFSPLLNVSVDTEKPKNGEPFEILKAKFTDDKNLWDVKALLIGSKMKEIPGYPAELEKQRTHLHISRDAISERERRLGLQVEGAS